MHRSASSLVRLCQTVASRSSETYAAALSASGGFGCSTSGRLLEGLTTTHQGACQGPSWGLSAPSTSRGLSWLAGPGGGSRLPTTSPAGFSALQQHHQAQQLRTMFIQTQPTPNPQSLMFVPGKPVMESGSHDFPNARAGMASPLARRLFAVDGVTSVFFGQDFITLTKKDDAQWAVLKPLAFAAIMDHYSSGEPLFSEAGAQGRSDTAIHEDDDEVVAMIKELLETRIRPAVQEDGGDITYRGFDQDTGIVTVKMAGACSGCPSSTVTLKSGIENMLMHYIPEVKGVVEEGPDESEELAVREFEKLEAQLAAGEQQQATAAAAK